MYFTIKPIINRLIVVYPPASPEAVLYRHLATHTLVQQTPPVSRSRVSSRATAMMAGLALSVKTARTTAWSTSVRMVESALTVI